jgi:BirA family biotin operon repressor/biotin-[acetyl-CoA-carboxylase] ligase
VAHNGTRQTPGGGGLGHPRLHLRRTDSTNERARALALAGAPHGTLVTAAEQSAGRGRQGRSWSAPPNSSLLCSLVLRDPPALLSLRAGVAVCDAVGSRARVKWPNDVVMEIAGGAKQTPAGSGAAQDHESSQASANESETALGKLAGILVEGRPQEGWAVVGIGLNVAVRVEELPVELRGRAVSLELPPSAIEPIMGRLIEALGQRLAEPVESVLDAWRGRDALLGREILWGAAGPDGRYESGRAAGIDRDGRLLVRLRDGTSTRLDAGEVHLGRACEDGHDPQSTPT